MLAWLIRFDQSLVPAVREVQAAFSRLEWIVPQPSYFLHISLGGVAFGRRRPTGQEIASALERARRVWASASGFEVTYRRINCFHNAVVAEVEGDGPRLLVEKLVEDNYWGNVQVDAPLAAVRLETYLPHLTIGSIKGANDPGLLKEVLIPLRDQELGKQRVTEASLCLIPASRTTILSPWEVVGSVALK